MENHHVCQTCSGVSDTEGTCTTEGCSSNGQPLTACSCENKEGHGSTEAPAAGAPVSEAPAETPAEGGETRAE